MEATTRIRLFNTRSADEEEGRAARGQRRRVDSVGRGRRRRHSRASKPRFFSRILRTRRSMLLLLVVTGAAGPFVSLRLLAWASSNMLDGGGGGGGLTVAIEDKPPSVSLGPDSIPSVVRVERRASLPLFRVGEGEDSAAADLGGGGHRDVCRNTVQGMALLADSQGRVCRRTDLDRRRPGCCNALPLSSWAAAAAAGAGGGLPDAAAEAIASMDGYVIQDTPALPPPRAAMSLRAGSWRKDAGRVEQVFTRALPAAAAGRQLAGHQSGVDYGFPPEEALSAPFSCWSCDAGGRGGTSSSCCASYEFCVSCCQDPRRKEEREAVRAAAVRSGHPAYGSLGYSVGGSGSGSRAVDGGKESAPALPLEVGEDRIDGEDSYREAAFDYCAFRCRTYSGSVVHENSFRGPLKHCFGKFRPPAAPDAASNSGDGGSVASQGGGAPLLQLDPLLVGFINE